MTTRNKTQKTELLKQPTRNANKDKDKAKSNNRNLHKWIILSVAVLLIVATASLVAWRMRVNKQITEARNACSASLNKVTSYANEYNKLRDGDAKVAAGITVDQVTDAKTVEALAKELGAQTPKRATCDGNDVKALNDSKVSLDKLIDWYKSHKQSLKQAIKAVNESKTQKDQQIAEEKARAEAEAKAKAEAEAKAKAELEAQQRAAQTRSPARTSSRNAGRSYRSTTNNVRTTNRSATSASSNQSGASPEEMQRKHDEAEAILQKYYQACQTDPNSKLCAATRGQ